MRLGWNSYLGFRADSTQECSQSNQFLLLHWISRFTHKYVTFPKQMGCKANSELTSARGLFFCKSDYSLCPLFIVQTRTTLWHQLSSLRIIAPEKSRRPLCSTLWEHLVLGGAEERLQGSAWQGGCRKGVHISACLHWQHQTTCFLSTNFSLPALSLFVKKKKNIGKDMHFAWQRSSTLKKYFTPRFCHQVLTLTMLL